MFPTSPSLCYPCYGINSALGKNRILPWSDSCLGVLLRVSCPPFSSRYLLHPRWLSCRTRHIWMYIFLSYIYIYIYSYAFVMYIMYTCIYVWCMMYVDVYVHIHTYSWVHTQVNVQRGHRHPHVRFIFNHSKSISDASSLNPSQVFQLYLSYISKPSTCWVLFWSYSPLH